MARKEFVNSSPLVMVADQKQAAKVDKLVEAPESGDFRVENLSSMVDAGKDAVQGIRD